MKISKLIKFNMIVLLISLSSAANASELINSANRDWLELVRQHTPASNSSSFDEAEADYKWQRLINKRDKRQPLKTESFLSEWWQTFGDDVLIDLIAKAFASNKDLNSTRAKVLEARAQLGISKTNFSPKANLASEYENGRNSDFEDDELKSYNKYALGFDASWEIDLFGRNKHTLKAAKANLESEYASLENAWVSLSAEVALNYFNLRILQKRLDIAENNLQVQGEFLEILKSQHSAGLIDEAAVAQGRYDLETTRASIPEITHSINELLTAIAILTGELPGSLDDKLSTPKDLPDVNISKLIGIPAETLRQRPDIKAAERKLAAQIQKRKAAEKSLYPVIQLVGSIGLESFSTGHLFSSGSYTYSIGPSISWPIFNAGEIRKNIQAQTAIEKQLALELEGVILKAVGEVHDALSAASQELSRNAALKDALDSAMTNLEITRDKYSKGLVNFTDVLKAQQAAYSIKSEYNSSCGKRLINLITLFKSLGGGYTPLNGL